VRSTLNFQVSFIVLSHDPTLPSCSPRTQLPKMCPAFIAVQSAEPSAFRQSTVEAKSEAWSDVNSHSSRNRDSMARLDSEGAFLYSAASTSCRAETSRK